MSEQRPPEAICDGAQAAPVLPAMAALLRRLSHSRSVEEVVEAATPAARDLLQADGVTFVLREGELCHYAEEASVSPLWKGRRFPLDACISGWCMTRGESTAVPDIYADDRIPHEAYRPTFVRSLVMVPVRRDDPLAAMGAYWREERVPSAEEIETLEAVADATALAFARLALEHELDQARRLSRELVHRIKNVLSVVDSLARQTLRSAPEGRHFAAGFLGRLQALARSQDLLSTGDGAAVDLHALLREQVLLGGGQRISCDGPVAVLPAGTAADFGLVLHELGTNARKHGALSNDSGRVEIAWQVVECGNRQMLELSWQERDGPPVAEPSRKGFGATLLHDAVAKSGGRASVRYDPAGLVCRIDLPLA